MGIIIFLKNDFIKLLHKALDQRITYGPEIPILESYQLIYMK